MKKSGIILLLFFYLIPVIGITVSAHFCGGKCSSVSLISTDKHDCPCGTKIMKKNCCKDINTYIKLKNVQQKSFQISINVLKTPVKNYFSNQFDNYLVRNATFSDILFSDFHPPNRKTSDSLFLLNNVFLI